MNLDFNEILKKHNYPEDFAVFLKKVYDAFIDYLGSDKEPIIYEAFLNTKFVFNKSVYDVLLEEDMLEANDVVTMEDLKRSSGVHSSFPIISYQNKEYKIEDIKRVVVTSKFDLNESWTIATFIHELGHLIKSYYNEFSIENDILIVRSGFIEEKYKLEVIDGKVERKLLSKTGTGLEEGLNSCLEEDMMQKYFDSNYKAHGYGGVRATASALQDDFNLKRVFLNAEFYKDFSEIEALIGMDLFEELKLLEDNFYRLDLDIFASIFDREKAEDLFKKENLLIKGEYTNLVDRLKNRGLSCQK